MKYVRLMLAVFLALPLVTAHVQIIAVEYNPIGNDNGKEWFQLYNPTNQTMDLSQYRIEAGNGRHNNDDWSTQWIGEGTLLPRSTFLVSEFAPADVVKSLNLQNGPDALRIRTHDFSYVETVGWGAHTFDTYYEGSPVPTGGDGWNIQRNCEYNNQWQCQSTNNNSADFTSIYNMTPFTFSHAPDTPIEVTLPATLPQITNISMQDEMPVMAGIQLLPAPQPRIIPVNLSIIYGTGNHSITQTIYQGEQAISNITKQVQCMQTCTLEDSFFLPAYPQAGQWKIHFTVDNIDSHELYFDVMASIHLDVEFLPQTYVNGDFWHIGMLKVTNTQENPITASFAFASHNLTLAQHVILANTTILHGKNTEKSIASGEHMLPMVIPRTLNTATAFKASIWVDVQ